MDNKITRRSFIQFLSGSVVALPAALSMSKLFALDLKSIPKGAVAVSEKAPMASALGFKQDATKVDTKRFKKYQAGQSCVNCAQFIKKNDSWGECKIIKGGLVPNGGWCNSYLAAKKPATT